MKGLILKDLYNISHNAKSMFFILLFFAVVFLPSSGTQGYMFTCTLLCTMMIVTTFTFDEFSNWTPYALIMPVSRENLVAGKYIVLVIFSAAGTLFGLLAALIGTRIAGNSVPVSGPADILPLGHGCQRLLRRNSGARRMGKRLRVRSLYQPSRRKADEIRAPEQGTGIRRSDGHPGAKDCAQRKYRRQHRAASSF